MFFDTKTEQFLLFLFIGIIMFQFFTESAHGSMNIFKTKRYLLENIQINKLDIFYSAISATFIGFLFNFVAFCFGNLLLNDSFSWSILYFPLVLINLIIMILATRLIFATISIYLKDIDSIWFVLNNLLFWGSGIFIDLSNLGGLPALIKYYNPLAGIFMNARDVLIYARPLDHQLLAINMLTAIVFLIIGLWGFKKYSAYALEKL